MTAADRLPRRAVLRSLVAVGAGAVLVPVAAACAGTPEGPDELEAPLAAARSDAALAGAAARAFPDGATRFSAVADARRAHADALAAEIRRARPDREDAIAAPVPDPPAPSSSGAASSSLRTSLGAARDAGAALAVGTARYRSGLVAAVAASCGGFAEVLA